MNIYTAISRKKFRDTIYYIIKNVVYTTAAKYLASGGIDDKKYS
jgi:hypothetical protein